MSEKNPLPINHKKEPSKQVRQSTKQPRPYKGLVKRCNEVRTQKTEANENSYL